MEWAAFSDVVAGSDTELLTLLGTKAVELGWAKPGYGGALVEREAAFPTGIQLPTCGVAIPHADREWTVVPAILGASLKEPVLFRNMEDPSAQVAVNLVVLMLIARPADHLRVLQRLVDLFQSGRARDLAQNLSVSALRDMLGEEVEPK